MIQPTAPVDTPRHIDHSILCSKCRFDLRGTALGSVCPECGQPVMVMLSGFRVDGRRLIVRSGVVLPGRCIKTNAVVEGAPTTKNLYWMNSLWLLTLLAGLLVLLIVYFIARRKCRLTYFISPAAKRKALYRQLAALGVFLLSLVAFFVGVTNDNGPVMIGGGVAFVAGLVLLAIFSNVLQVTKARNGEFWIKGFGPEFLETIRASEALRSPRAQ